MKKAILTILTATTVLSCLADSLRTVIPLDTGWICRPISNPIQNAKREKVTLPHTWNSQYINSSEYNRETMVYSREIPANEKSAGMRRQFLYFEGVNSVADVFVNRRSVGQHKGGYTAFCMEITDFLRNGNNTIEVWASNAFRTDVLPLSGDFNVYGGIHRPVRLITTGPDCISPLYYGSSGVLVRQDKVTNKNADLSIETHLSLTSGKPGLRLRTTICESSGKEAAKAETAVNSETIVQQLSIPNPKLWNGRKNPYLYTVTVELCDEDGNVIDRVEDSTGVRYFSVDKDKGFYLNGERYPLYGFNRHEDVEGKGSALTAEDHKLDMSLIAETGATMVRLSHYPQNQLFYRLADKQGIILWSEIPLCGPGGYDFTGYLRNAEENARQTALEMVYQNMNRPSVCFWGIFNELLVDTERFKSWDDPVEFVKELDTLYKAADPTRLTTFATCVPHQYYEGCSDLIAWNKYFRRPGNEEQVRKFFNEAYRTSGNQPIGISEYGDAGNISQHFDPRYDKARTHSETYQAMTHEGYWRAIKDSEWLWCKCIWQFSDMQSSIRHEGDRDGMNDKGMVSYDRAAKKDIYYFYKAQWNPEPMVYITDRRFIDRHNSPTDIKVYSNLPEATLYINGKKVATRKADDIHRIIFKDVKLEEGSNHIEVKAGNLHDECMWTLTGSSVLASHASWAMNIPKAGPLHMPEKIAEISAPFDVSGIRKPDFSSRNTTVKMRKDGFSTANIQEAIDKTSAAGGGTVTIPAGKWETGRIELKSGVCLHLSEGTSLLFSGSIKDYQPAVETRNEGYDVMSPGAMIYANGAENIGITGKGLIIGPDTDCELYVENKKYLVVEECVDTTLPVSQRICDGLDGRPLLLPMMIAPFNCKNVLIENITIDQGLFWNIAPQYCDNVIIRGVTVNSAGHGRTDGIDIESSSNVLVEYCSLDCGDDCYTIKSGRGMDGVKKDRPSFNVVIRHCIALRGAGGLVLGSETAANMHSIYMHDCIMNGTDQAFRFKTRRPRGGGGHDILIERVHAKNIKYNAFSVDMLGSKKWVGELADRYPAREITQLTPEFKNIHIRDITIDGCARFVDVKALPESQLSHVLIENATVRCSNFIRMQDCDSFVLHNAVVDASTAEISLDGCKSVMLLNVDFTGDSLKEVIKDSSLFLSDI